MEYGTTWSTAALGLAVFGAKAFGAGDTAGMGPKPGQHAGDLLIDL